MDHQSVDGGSIHKFHFNGYKHHFGFCFHRPSITPTEKNW
jgi:hypothetical protein